MKNKRVGINPALDSVRDFKGLVVFAIAIVVLGVCAFFLLSRSWNAQSLWKSLVYGGPGAVFALACLSLFYVLVVGTYESLRCSSKD